MHILLESENELCCMPLVFFRAVAEAAFFEAGIDFSKKTISIAVSAAAGEEMRKINRERRGKDETTDILSFAEFSSLEEIVNEGGKAVYIGEIIVNCPYIARRAKEDGVSMRRECAFLFSHGVLHLLGFEHGEEMFGIQDRVCDRIDKRAEKNEK